MVHLFFSQLLDFFIIFKSLYLTACSILQVIKALFML